MITARYPLSYGQQGIWLAQQMRGTTAAYHDHEVFELTGPLDLPAFRTAVDALTRRHEMLRTRFVTLNGEPCQVVDDHWQGQVQVEHATAGQPRGVQLHMFVRRLARRPLELGEDPLFQVDVLSLGDQDHVVAFTMHHIITDGWSVRLMLEELSCSYAGALTGRSVQPEPAAQYGAFATWQRTELQGAEREALLAYWTQHLAGAPTRLPLPPATGSRPAATLAFDVPAGAVQDLGAAARTYGATLFMALFGTFAVALSTTSGVNDLLIGVPVVGRTVPGFEASLGYFVNLLALRADLRDDPTGSTLLRQVRQSVLDGFAHQDLPFEQLVAEINPARSPDTHPLVQATLQLIDGSFESALRLQGVEATVLRLDEPEIAYALTLDLHTDADGLHGRLTYTPDAVEQEWALRLADLFARLVVHLPKHLHSTVSGLKDQLRGATP